MAKAKEIELITIYSDDEDDLRDNIEDEYLLLRVKSLPKKFLLNEVVDFFNSSTDDGPAPVVLGEHGVMTVNPRTAYAIFYRIHESKILAKNYNPLTLEVCSVKSVMRLQKQKENYSKQLKNFKNAVLIKFIPQSWTTDDFLHFMSPYTTLINKEGPHFKSEAGDFYEFLITMKSEVCAFLFFYKRYMEVEESEEVEGKICINLLKYLPYNEENKLNLASFTSLELILPEAATEEQLLAAAKTEEEERKLSVQSYNQINKLLDYLITEVSYAKFLNRPETSLDLEISEDASGIIDIVAELVDMVYENSAAYGVTAENACYFQAENFKMSNNSEDLSAGIITGKNKWGASDVNNVPITPKESNKPNMKRKHQEDTAPEVAESQVVKEPKKYVRVEGS